MKKTTLVLVWALISTALFSQDRPTGKRISITNPTHAQITTLGQLGLDLSCGAVFQDGNLLLELAQEEIQVLDSIGINYTVLIDDLTAFFEEKTQVELPQARAQLQAMKSRNVSYLGRSSNTSASVDNLVQYEGCSEIDWTANVPSNFNLGSMAGCLTYQEVLNELDQMRALYPNLISVKAPISSNPNHRTHGNTFTNGGQYDTWGRQDVLYVRISDNPDTDEANEPESLYSGMTHSREVSSMMNLMYYMWYILENYDTDAGVRNLVDNHEMYFIPVANPDGLLWNEQIAPSGGGMQRKNLGPYNTGNSSLRGVDLNRNYDYFWGPGYVVGGVGSSGTQSSDVYRGPTAFSEPETQGIEAFIASRNIVTAMNHHATSNLIPHAYNGNPTAPPSGREDDFHKFCHDMTRYNRYIYGEAPDILTIANGDMSDWMLGGSPDDNGSSGSGQGILALAPENGAWDGSEGGFWPNPTDIVLIAQRAMRMNFMNAYYSGKFAQLHDLNSSDITTTSGNLLFGIEYLGQTLGDISLNVTPVSLNISSMTPPATQTGWTKLEQRELMVAYNLDAGIQPNDEIEFQVTLSNDDGYVMYQANIKKYYTPSIIFQDDPDSTGIINWTSAGGSWGTTSDAYSGTTAITDSPSGSYGNGELKRLTLDQTIDLSGSNGAVVQFYAKWDLERNFDYVQFQASVNGGAWTELCGTYTKPGSDRLTNRYSSGNSSNTGPGKSTNDRQHQPSGQAVYDGDTQDKWVMEEFFIDDNNNSFLLGQSDVRFRFLLDSDSSNRADGYSTTFDGFYFDDFRVIDTPLPCLLEIPSGLTADTVLDTSAILTWNSVQAATYDIRYRETGTTPWTNINNINAETVTLSQLTELTEYQVQVRSRCGTSTSSYSGSITFTTFDVISCTGTLVNVFPYTETFNSGLGDWSQVSGDDGNWIVDAGGTPSGNTGPSDDITGGGNYLFLEASSNNSPGEIGSNATAILESPCFDLNLINDAVLSFKYHLFGANQGNLDVAISNDDGITWTTIFNISGNQGDSWFSETIDLSAYNNQVVKFRFIGTTGNGFASDMAIDQISISATPLDYCASQGADASEEYISRVQVNTIDNSSNGQSYSDFTSISTYMSKNTQYTITITPTWPGQTFNEGYGVWIDYNRDGDFEDAGEQVFSQAPTSASSVSGSFTIPSNIPNGATRMRVSMRYNALPPSCGSFDFGEVEDYTVNLFDGLLYQNNTWTPNAPNTNTGSENAWVLDGTFNANFNFDINNLRVSTGAELNLDKANGINVNGNVLNEGQFILNSDCNEFSSIVTLGSFTGNAVYHRHVNSNANGNDLIGPPVGGQAFIDFLGNNNNVFANGDQTVFLFGDFEKPINDYQLFTDSETEALETGKGYRVASTDDETFMFSGTVTTGPVNLPIERSGTNFAKWNLIGNPYPSYIRLADFLSANIAELDAQSAAVYGYDADNSDGSVWTIWNLAFSDANPNTLIAPGQGFFVSSQAGGSNISFTPSMQTTGTADDFILGRDGSTNTIQHGLINIVTASNAFSTDLYFTDNASLQLDLGYDAEHFGGAPTGFSIFTRLQNDSDGLDLAIQSIAFNDVESNPLIPLGVHLGQGQQATISLGDSDLDVDVYLEDTLTNTSTLLSTAAYTFTPNTDLTGTGRFYIRFESNALSVEETALDRIQIISETQNEQIVVSGVLHSETEFKLYDIQGREILAMKLDSNSNLNAVPTVGFTSGVYLVKLTNETTSISKKLIIK